MMTDDDQASQVEPAHSLLLSSLRFWEVERDLIEERKAAINRWPFLCAEATSRPEGLPKSRVEV